MSISTGASNARAAWLGACTSRLSAMWVFFPAVVIGWGRLPQRAAKRFRLLAIGFLFAITAVFSSCGGVSAGSGGTGISPQNPVTYHITVTGTSAGTPSDAGQSTIVALVVN